MQIKENEILILGLLDTGPEAIKSSVNLSDKEKVGSKERAEKGGNLSPMRKK